MLNFVYIVNEKEPGIANNYYEYIMSTITMCFNNMTTTNTTNQSKQSGSACTDMHTITY